MQETPVTKEVHSTPSHLRLVAYRPESYAGIHKDISTQFHIFFTDDKPIVGFEGDQGLFKTSNIKCLEALLGGEEVKNALNRLDNNKKSEMVYEDPTNGDQYIGRITKSGFTLTLLQKKGEALVRSTLSEPKSLIRKLVGPIGISPMFLKGMKGPEQITWLKGMYHFDEEQRTLENNIATKYDTNFKGRTEVSRQLKYLKEDLVQSKYYGWDVENKVLTPTDLLTTDKETVAKAPANDEAINSNFNKKNEKLNEYKRGVERLAQHKNNLKLTEEKMTEIELKIKELQELLVTKGQELALVKDSIAVGEKYLEDNKNAQEEFDAAKKDIENAGEIKLKRQQIDTAEKKLAKFHEQEKEHTRLSALLEECKKLQLELTRSFTPDIEGLEIVTDGMNIDEPEGKKDTRSEGLYYREKTPLEMSESELWDFCLQLWHHFQVRIVIIENIQDLGTNAIERVNWFAKNGGRVFYTAMERTIKKTQVTYLDEIPVEVAEPAGVVEGSEMSKMQKNSDFKLPEENSPYQ